MTSSRGLSEYDRLGFAGRKDFSGVRGGLKRPLLTRLMDFPYDRDVSYGVPAGNDRGTSAAGPLENPLTPKDAEHFSLSIIDPDGVDEIAGSHTLLSRGGSSQLGSSVPGSSGGWAHSPVKPWDEEEVSEGPLNIDARPAEVEEIPVIVVTKPPPGDVHQVDLGGGWSTRSPRQTSRSLTKGSFREEADTYHIREVKEMELDKLQEWVNYLLSEGKKKKKSKDPQVEDAVQPKAYSYSEAFDFSQPLGSANRYKNQGAAGMGPWTGTSIDGPASTPPHGRNPASAWVKAWKIVEKLGR